MPSEGCRREDEKYTCASYEESGEGSACRRSYDSSASEPVSYTHLDVYKRQAAAVGTGTVGEGMCNISLGTSGTIFISSKDVYKRQIMFR